MTTPDPSPNPAAVARKERTGLRVAGIPVAFTSVGGLVGFLIGRSVEVPMPSAFWDLAAQPLATAAAGAGAITAGYLALHNGTKTRALDAQHHTDTMNRDRVADFRSRYTTAAQQIGNKDSAAIREAGIYALSALVDDWLRYGEDSDQRALSQTQARACVNLLCSYLRANRDLADFQNKEGTEFFEDFHRDELSVRNTVVGVLRDHISSWRSIEDAWRKSGHLTTEPGMVVDLNGAVLRKANLSGTDLRGAQLIGAVLARATIHKTDLTDANMTGANLSRSDIENVDFTRALLRHVDLTGSKIADTKFDGADVHSAKIVNARLIDVGLRNVYNFNRVDFDDTCVYTELTTWPRHENLPGQKLHRTVFEIMKQNAGEPGIEVSVYSQFGRDQLPPHEL